MLKKIKKEDEIQLLSFISLLKTQEEPCGNRNRAEYHDIDLYSL